MRSLLDVNVLVALFDEDHTLHEAALRWFDESAQAGWASCPITQNGCVRIMSQPGYPNPQPVAAIVQRLRDATSHRAHESWPDDVTLVDDAKVDPTHIHGPKQLTDVYLLALAVAHRGRLVTFDQGISLASVAGAQKKHLVVL